MAEAAARAGDNICHTSALAGFIVGTVIGAALIAYVAFATFTCGFGAALLTGLLAGVAASGIRSLGEWVGSKCQSTTGKILRAGCSTNVLINGKKAARAVVSNAECSKDMPLAPIAEGSSNVFFNQKAAARKDDKIQCGATISEGSDNVIIGGGKTQYLAVKDEVPAWIRKASDIAFTVAGIAGGAAGAFKQAGGVFNKCALKFVAGYVAGSVAGVYVSDKIMGFIGGLFGNPTDITSGQKILFDEQELDFVIFSKLPFFWQRYYSSELSEGVLGKGWRLDFEVSLLQDDEQLIYCGRTGQNSYFPKLSSGEYSYSSESQLFLYCMPDGRHVVRTLDDIYTVFPPFKDSKQVFLQHIEDINRNYIHFHYDENSGRLTGINDSWNNILICHWHPTLDRLLSVERLTASGKKELLINYAYDKNGNLSTVCNQSGTITRRFTYNEKSLMTGHTNALGMQCFYEWGEINHTWCVTESYNNEGEQARYIYDFENNQTSVIDERNLKATWQYNEQQQVICFTDFNQDIYRIEYNSMAMPIAFHLPGERNITIERDNLSRIIKECDPLGRITHTDYWLNTLSVIRKTFPDGSIWQGEYDDKGNLLIATDPMGYKTLYTWNEQGLPIQITDATGGKKTLVWNKRAQLIQHVDCSGKSVNYHWNEHGDLLSITNMLGEKTDFNYNLQHELETIQYPDGTQEYYSYFSSGLLKKHTDAAGQQREWCYNQRGQPLQFTDRLNRKLYYFYDVKGNLKQLLNASGGEYQFSYDVAGRLTEELRPDRMRRQFSYDKAGLPASLTWLGSEHSARQPQVRHTQYHYDKGNRMVLRRTSMAEFFYDYDAADHLIQLQRKPTVHGSENQIEESQLTFRWDKNGQLLEESRDGEKLEYSWDPLGNLTDLRLPDADALHWFSYGSGHVGAIRFNQHLITEFERDDLHREVLRTQGMLTQSRGYDVRGRRIWQSTVTKMLTKGITSFTPRDGKLWRTFDYNRASELVQTEDPFRGRQHYRYDAESRLLEYDSPIPAGGKEQFSYDNADNIYGLPDLDWKNIHSGKPDEFRTNRLPFWKHNGFAYDGYGNLTRRIQGSLTQYFTYDDENRLIQARGEGPKGHYQARYHYDALGRRTAKTVTYQHEEPVTIRFRWQGMRLIQEVSAEHTRSYVYDPQEVWTPLARITRQGDNQKIDYFHTDLNSAPLEVTGHEGDIIWCGKYSAWGKLHPQVHLEGEIKGLPCQPLRYAGQYCDDESGLHYNTFRYYDPEVGRFTTQDPIGLNGGINLYQYAPNPLTWSDPLGLAGNPATATHITYLGIDVSEGKPYVGYASMQGNQMAQDVLNYRYSGNFDRFGGQAPRVLYGDYGQSAKDVARGLEQRTFEQLGGLDDTANRQNPVGQRNARRTEYLAAADEHLNSKKGGGKTGGDC